jgi:AraC-like DNA-binding protein
MNNIWTMSGVLMVYGASLDAKPHSHNAVQIVWPSDVSCLHVGSEVIKSAAVISANVPHQLEMAHGWVVLVEPQSQLGENLIAVLNGQTVRAWNEIPPFDGGTKQLFDSPLTALAPLFQGILSSIHDVHDLNRYVQLTVRDDLDRRIKHLLNDLNACFEQACLKPEKWKAADVAVGLGLSESRFLHVFKEQMGIAWRPFLLWRRMLCAVNLLIAGSPATQAAHVAGFSDSAHLSRNFRAMFGLSIRQASQVLKAKD